MHRHLITLLTLAANSEFTSCSRADSSANLLSWVLSVDERCGEQGNGAAAISYG